VDGVIQSPPTVISAIREVVQKSGVQGKDAVVSLAGHSVITKKLRLPAMKEEELAESITWEAEQHVPFAIDEVYLDFQILGEASGDPTAMDVILVAVKKTKVDDYLAVIRDAGLNPVVVDVDTFALENQYELNHPTEQPEVVALIDVGAAFLKTNVLHRGVSIFARDVAFGGNQYTQAIAQRTRLPFPEAEALKRGEDVPGVSWDDIVPALEAVSRDLSLEIQRTFDYFASTSGADRVDRIVLSGGCARLKGIDTFLSSSWRVPVELADPFKNLVVDPARFPTETLDEVGPAGAVVVGLGLRRPGDKP
jgi:type IV pilus assembly protein PilM